jgi:hypothetical protein
MTSCSDVTSHPRRLDFCSNAHTYIIALPSGRRVSKRAFVAATLLDSKERWCITAIDIAKSYKRLEITWCTSYKSPIRSGDIQAIRNIDLKFPVPYNPRQIQTPVLSASQRTKEGAPVRTNYKYIFIDANILPIPTANIKTNRASWQILQKFFHQWPWLSSVFARK